MSWSRTRAYPLASEHWSETELTLALAAVLDAEPEMAAEFVRLVVRKATHADRVDLTALPARLRCSAEDKIAEGRADLTFADKEHRCT